MTVSDSQVVIYKAPAGSVSVEVKLQGETVWLTQKQMSALFEIERSVITKHLKNIFKTKELEEKSVSAKIAHTAADGRVVYELYGLTQEEIAIVEGREK